MAQITMTVKCDTSKLVAAMETYLEKYREQVMERMESEIRGAWGLPIKANMERAHGRFAQSLGAWAVKPADGVLNLEFFPDPVPVWAKVVSHVSVSMCTPYRNPVTGVSFPTAEEVSAIYEGSTVTWLEDEDEPEEVIEVLNWPRPEYAPFVELIDER